MKTSYEFLTQVLNSVTEHIAVIDQAGNIVFVNQNWSQFGENNACTSNTDWSHTNYLDECEKAAKMGDGFGTASSLGIRNILSGKQPNFYLEYPCHSPNEKRWFMMRVTPLTMPNGRFAVISHQNITERKLAEEKVLQLSRIDGLTGIPNRRYFDDFLHNEWMRCTRLKKPISLALIDLDHFKLLNDTHGHIAGDECLIKIGRLLKSFSNRPGDLCARYGGEEFALIWSDTPYSHSKHLANNLIAKISELNISNASSPIAPMLTASVGLATVTPHRDDNEKHFISVVDNFLYKAKNNGRNRLESTDEQILLTSN